MRIVAIVSKGMMTSKLWDVETIKNLGYKQKNFKAHFNYIIATSKKEFYTTNLKPIEYVVDKFRLFGVIDLITVNTLIDFIELENVFLLHENNN